MQFVLQTGDTPLKLILELYEVESTFLMVTLFILQLDLNFVEDKMDKDKNTDRKEVQNNHAHIPFFGILFWQGPLYNLHILRIHL